MSVETGNVFVHHCNFCRTERTFMAGQYLLVIIVAIQLIS